MYVWRQLLKQNTKEKLDWRSINSHMKTLSVGISAMKTLSVGISVHAGAFKTMATLSQQRTYAGGHCPQSAEARWRKVHRSGCRWVACWFGFRNLSVLTTISDQASSLRVKNTMACMELFGLQEHRLTLHTYSCQTWWNTMLFMAIGSGCGCHKTLSYRRPFHQWQRCLLW